MAYYMDSDPMDSLERVEMVKQQMEADQASDNILNLQGENKMNREEFWKLIDSTLDAEDQEEQLKLIKTELMKLSRVEVASFDNILGKIKDKATCWELLGAGHIIKGKCISKYIGSFLLWIISKGQFVYENALKNPDSLAEVITQRDIDQGVQFERLSYIAWDVYKEKTGRKMWNDRRSNSDLERDRDIKAPEEMLDDDEFDERCFRKIGKLNHDNYFDVIDSCPNLLQGFIDCFLSSKTNPLKGKKLGFLSIDGGFEKTDNFIINRLS
jgi:hypothetical protein